MNKILGFSLCLWTVCIFSKPNIQCEGYENCTNCCDCKDTCNRYSVQQSLCDCCACTPNPSCEPPCDIAYNAPYRIGVCWDVFVSANYLYWECIEGGLSLGQNVHVVDNLEIKDSSCIPFDFSYESGFKVGLGFNFNWDNWDCLAEYTWVRNCPSTSQSADIGIVTDWLFPVLNDNIDPEDVSLISADWDLDFNIVDFQLGRSFYSGQRLVLRFHIGGRAVWSEQDYKIELDLPVNNTVKSCNHFENWMIGIRSGWESQWLFCYGFFLYGNSSISLLYTEIEDTKITQTDTSIDEIIDFTCDETVCITSNVDLSAGLGWGDYCDECSKWFITLRVGYDFSLFTHQNVWREAYASNESKTDLFFHGLHVSARIDF